MSLPHTPDQPCAGLHDLCMAATDRESASNYRIIRPYIPLCQDLISHRISIQKFQSLFEQYGPFKTRIRTCYYLDDMVLVRETTGRPGAVTQTSCYRERYVESVPCEALELEYTGLVRNELSPDLFPLTLQFNHERQGIVYESMHEGYTLILEILVPFLRPSIDIDDVYTELIEYGADMPSDARYPDSVVSLSYQVVLNQAHHLTAGALGSKLRELSRK